MGKNLRRATLLGVLLLSACSGRVVPQGAVPAEFKPAPSCQAQHIVVFAASSLTEAFTELADEYKASTGGCITVDLTFGASSTLAQQIVDGAPAQAFAAASPQAMQASGITNAQVFASNRVVLALPVGNRAGLTSVEDLDKPLVKWAQCAPEVPCGAAATRALAASNLRSKPVSLAPDVKSLLALVLSNEIDAGVVYHTDVVANPDLQEIEFADQKAASTDYLIGSTSGNEAAAGFIKLVTSEQGKDVLTAAGFATP